PRFPNAIPAVKGSRVPPEREASSIASPCLGSATRMREGAANAFNHSPANVRWPLLSSHAVIEEGAHMVRSGLAAPIPVQHDLVAGERDGKSGRQGVE